MSLHCTCIVPVTVYTSPPSSYKKVQGFHGSLATVRKLPSSELITEFVFTFVKNEGLHFAICCNDYKLHH